ncbi:AsnC-family transcriptional regulator [Saccharopolyspora erythraea NRRL 2338]|uniref:AsnC-family transcriptional regulator n=1 Tax=Saccharopolyspora erythraea (strain ATCC 11635 / DSM 40517 / JCM 4748 / NBRC 13426 / NCIMB 8594 / NRRL 2338) TaxID=405948 RepID=A4FLC8_SACEN|nr:AsnC family transcriptional regulator [Saccharopolyspora erythraea D]CAM04853.1 AsnC-family transcriptional regulator [Saccharopolyspora erythraea NRRL 2338]
MDQPRRYVAVARKPVDREQDNPDSTSKNTAPARSTVAVDELSKLIIEQLQEDGRRSYAAIGKAVGLSEAAVRQRVQRLLDSGMVQIVAVTDPLQLGFLRQAMIGVKVSGDAQRVADELAEIEEIEYVVVTAGSFDVLVEVVCRDDDQLLEVINRRIRSLDAVTGTETFVYLKLRKQTYAWGTLR